MIDRAYCRCMSRYNAWQNKALWGVLQQIDPADLMADIGLPHASALGTLNHLLWLDQMWLSRLSDVTPPRLTADETASLTPTPAAWWAERFRADGALRKWADRSTGVALTGEFAFWSITTQSDVIASRAVCVMHMFTQQTDLRGRVSQALSQLGQKLPPTALFLMPQD